MASEHSPGTQPEHEELAQSARAGRRGLFSGIGAYVLWGVFPIYFHYLRDVSPFVVLCHRILWSCLFLGLVVTFRKEWQQLVPIFQNKRTMLLLFAGSILIAINWLVFIYAVAIGQLLQSSLGYFINPVLSIALGMIFLGERLRAMQWIAVGAAVAAVANLAFRASGLPWIALSLALSFGFYGLVRKRVNLNSLHALLVESALLAPLAGTALIFLPEPFGGPKFGLLSISGVLTATPLLMFGAAVRRLKLSTLGFLQYIGPSIQFLIAVALFREPLDQGRMISFSLCWVAVALYVVDSVLARTPQEVADEPE